MALDDTFAAARQQVLQRYGAAISCPGEALLCVVADSSCSEACFDAIDKTAEARGYGAGNVVRVTVDAPSGPLDVVGLFETIEGLDPVSMCVVGPAAIKLLAQAYGIEEQPFARVTVLGRPACLIANMSQLLDAPDGRQKAWSLLKTLPVFPG